MIFAKEHVSGFPTSGLPFVRFNDFVGRIGYLRELEDTYHLGFGIKASPLPKSNPQLVPQLTNNSSNNPLREQDCSAIIVPRRGLEVNPSLACSPTQQSSPLACSLSIIIPRVMST